MARSHLSMLTAAVAITFGTAFGTAARCAAQVAGRVVAESSQVAVPGATVELWTAAGRAARTESDADGRFTVASRPNNPPAWLLVRRIGFAPVTVRNVYVGRDNVVALRPLPVPLPELVITTCPGPDDPVSRRLWEAARSRYRLVPPGLLVFAGIAFVRFETTSADSVGYGAPEERAGTGGYVGLGSFWPRLLASGYVLPRAPGSYITDNQGAFEYMRLDGQMAEHFADSLFGALHVLLPAHYEDGLVIVPFCPRSTRHPEIEGAISFVPGAGFANAWWRFVVRRGEQQAGGQVFFAPPSDTGASFLIPARGVFWRVEPRSKRYFQALRVYDGWGIGEDWYRRTHSDSSAARRPSN